MRALSELLDQQTRGESIAPNPNNKVTKNRKGLYNQIMSKANNDSNAAYAIAMSTLEDYIPRLQEFVIEHSEEPAYNLPDLVQQVYQLRMKDVYDAQEILDYNTDEAITHLDQQEADFEKENGYQMDSFLGELFAPIEIVYSHIKGKQVDNFGAEQLASAIIPAIGQKVNSATLIRAAQGKKPGILGTLSTGGKRHYEGLLQYFKNNPEAAQKVLSGEYTDESQLPGWRVITPKDTSSPLNKIADDVVGNQFKKAIPYIIGFVLLIGIIVYFASRSKK